MTPATDVYSFGGVLWEIWDRRWILTHHAHTARTYAQVQYGTLDCAKFRQFCSELKVTLFPHIAYFDRMPDKTASEYSLEKNVYLGSLSNPKEIHEFASQAARPPVHELDPETIEKHV